MLYKLFDLPFKIKAVIRVMAVVAMETTVLAGISALGVRLHLLGPTDGGVILYLE